VELRRSGVIRATLLKFTQVIQAGDLLECLLRGKASPVSPLVLGIPSFRITQLYVAVG